MKPETHIVGTLPDQDDHAMGDIVVLRNDDNGLSATFRRVEGGWLMVANNMGVVAQPVIPSKRWIGARINP